MKPKQCKVCGLKVKKALCKRCEIWVNVEFFKYLELPHIVAEALRRIESKKYLTKIAKSW